MDRKRLMLLGGAIAAAIVVVVVVVLVAGGGSGSSTTNAATTTSGGGGSTEATTTFTGIPQHGDTLGRTTAPAALYVFEDPQCPYCKQWNIDTLPTVVENYVRTGKLKVVYRGIEVIDDNSLVGIAAAYAAGRQSKLWQMVEALYERQAQEGSGWITKELVREASNEIGVNADRVLADMKSAAVTNEIRKSINEAKSYGINSTPTFGIQRQLGTLQPLQITGLEPSGFTPGLDAALK